MRKNVSALKLDLTEDFLSKINSEKFNENNNSNTINSLLKHKIFLNKILHLIKISQIDYLSQISFNSKKIKNNNNNTNTSNINKIIKDMLINLKNELISTLKDNTVSKAKMQNIMNNNKSFLVKSMFDFERENINNLRPNTDRKIKKNKKIENDDDEYYKYNIELPHLKLLNFRIENQLQYMNIIIKIKTENYKNDGFNLNDEYYIFCTNQNDNLDASKYLHDNLIDIRNEFKSTVKKKEIQNRELIILNSKVTSLREEVELMGKKSSNDYVNTSDIINEESREYYTKTNICTIENSENVNKALEYNDNNYIKKNLIRVNKINSD